MATHHVLTLKEAAEFLNVKQSWLRSRIFKKEIKYVKLGRHIRFIQEDLEQFINANMQQRRK